MEESMDASLEAFARLLLNSGRRYNLQEEVFEDKPA